MWGVFEQTIRGKAKWETRNPKPEIRMKSQIPNPNEDKALATNGHK
jgi:hypothetical protein